MKQTIEELSKNVTDPSDFPKNELAPGLRDLDKACRCSICGDIFDAPMMLQCGHSFCSLCVRQFLRERHECPSCRAQGEEIHLVKNVAIEELSMKWKVSRPFILDLIEKVASSSRPIKKRRLNSDLDTSVENTPKPPLKRPSSDASSSTGNSKPDTGSREIEVAELIEDSEDDDFLQPELVPSSDVEENNSISDQDNLIDCPLCARKVRLRNINAHLDSQCSEHIASGAASSSKKQRNETKNKWNTMFSSAKGNGTTGTRKGKETARIIQNTVDESAERLPKPNYHSLKEKKIREMLSEYGLPSLGAKGQLVARHTQFVILYNSNLDRPISARKTLGELRKELKAWEDSLTVKKTMIDDNNAYLKSQNTEFRKRIEEARASHTRDKAKFSKNIAPPDQAQTVVSNGGNRDSEEEHQVSPVDVDQGVQETIISDSEEELERPIVL